MGARWLLVVMLLAGCAAHPLPPPRPVPSWDFAARPTHGEVRVLPVLVDVEPASAGAATWTGVDLSVHRWAARHRRIRDLRRVPEAVGIAVPGAVARVLGDDWQGWFRAAAWPAGSQERVLAAIRGRAGIEPVLGELARQVGGQATLVVWVDDLEGTPLSAEVQPGAIARTTAGPVVVDPRAEPYRVHARIGLALVAADGEVVIRYRDGFETVLAEARDAEGAGRSLALALAHEVATVWPCDPRLAAAEPARRW